MRDSESIDAELQVVAGLQQLPSAEKLRQQLGEFLNELLDERLQTMRSSLGRRA